MNNKRALKKMQPIIKKINSYRETYGKYTDDEMKNKAAELKDRRKTEKASALLPEAFALVREATKRTLNKEHYDVQLMAGIALFEGNIAEAKTGEGKTITIYLPAFLASLEGKSVYVVTVNDYLAHRDAMDARKVFEYLGVSVGLVMHDDYITARKEAYHSDITYVTNSELGFDYLKDHLVMNKYDTVLNGFNYAIIDEIDSILIDEAKTPLIISGEGPDVSEILTDVNRFVRGLKAGVAKEKSGAEKLLGEKTEETGDYIKEEKENRIYLTELGIEKMEEHFGINDYDDMNAMSIQRSVNNALRANYLMKKDKDYIIRDNKVEIIDTFTGRVLPGRRFSDGLHQALEVKENVEIQKENVTVATITFQSFFNKFKKKCGLTGTAMTSAKEFKDIYNLSVIEIPTNKPVIRTDLEDCVFRTKEEKWNAVIKETVETNKTGQPVLIGTSSIKDSEIVSDMLDKIGLAHNTLNAKNEELEAEIIATAGQFGSVTVATNMAGRGTDIVLDEKSREAGGLKVIGTERHDSRRIDNQLKGRSGRQGDPGSSQFFISLEDRALRVFGDKNSINTLLLLATEPGEALQYRPLSKIVNKAQEAIESENRLSRENMLKYDESDNEHREQMYEQREFVLENNPDEVLRDFFNDVSDGIVERYLEENHGAINLISVLKTYHATIAADGININLDGQGDITKENLIDLLHQVNTVMINHKIETIGSKQLAETAMRISILRALDMSWTLFLSSMESVKQNIGHQAYAQRDPAIEYKKKGVELFNDMIDNIQINAVRNFNMCRISIDNVTSEDDHNSNESNNEEQ